MTVLRHQLLGIDGNPVAGHTASVMAYQPEAPGKGYRRTTVVSAVSDDDGFLEWKLPRPKTGVTNPVYVVTGIEAQQVLVTVPTSVSTATVAETRTGTLPLPPGAENGTDLVTEEELATRLAGLTPALPARLSEEALRAAYVSAGAVHNVTPENVRRLRAAMGRAFAGAGLCRLSFWGDSLTVGYPSVPGTTDLVSLLRRHLAALGFPVGELVHVFNGSPAEGLDPRVAFGGTWASTGHTGFPYAFTTAAGATLTFTGSGTVFEVVSSGSSGAWTVSIDGGAPVTFTGSGANVPETLTVPGLSDGPHTAVITTADSWCGFHSLGFRPVAGVVLENAALSGASTAIWLTANSGFGAAEIQTASGYFDHDVVFLELGKNDESAAVPAATYATRLTELAQRALDTGASLIIGGSTDTQGAEAAWPPYLAEAREVADTLNVPFIDFTDLLGTYGVRGDLGLVADATHHSAAGNAMKAAAYLSVITA